MKHSKHANSKKHAHNRRQPGGVLSMDRRKFLSGMAGAAAVTGLHPGKLLAASSTREVNLARVAIPTSRLVTSENKISALNDGAEPVDSRDRTHGLYALRHLRYMADEGAPWVQYTWSEPVSVDKVDVYWAADAPRPAGYPGSERGRIALPASYKISYWNGSDFVPVTGATGLGVEADRYNTTAFTAVKTTKLRLEVEPDKQQPAGILEWRVYNAGPVPELAPVVDAGIDRDVVLGGKTYLSGSAIWLEDKPGNVARWSKVSGPGNVNFADRSAAVTTATFSSPGDYVLGLTASGSKGQTGPTLHVHAEAAPPPDRLDVVYTRKYSIDNPLWNERAKTLIVDWIPHCIRQCERTDIPAGRGDGGIDNFIEAGKANRGEPHGPHKGYVFSNAWVHQTVESMCIALMVDPQGDPDIEQAHQMMRETLDRWIPIILAAQMPDGYLQTAYILADRSKWPERWSPEHRGNHEGYVSGYFIESAINHYTLTDGKDLRLYNGAKKLADCWVANIGPGKKAWFDGHQEMEQALVRFGRFVNDQEGNGRGNAYITLAKFLLDSRRGGSEYDQSHLPPGQQYEAVGHAVRATYFYSGMADIAAETHDLDYQSAVLSLYDNMVNRKWYITGGIGSGETSEGFGPNYSLRNNAYCESCSSCGLVFFLYKMNLAYHDAKYADLYEQTMYNALFGGVALDGKSFCYTNPLINTERTLWHVCPCCVGNIPRTLLMVPTWAYVKSRRGVYVNLFIGSRVHVGDVDGTGVEMVQKTEYPWKGNVRITVNPEQDKEFSVYVRLPDRHTSALYTETPRASGYTRFLVNGQPYTPHVEKGYAVVKRKWTAGDHIEVELPMIPQRVVADERVRADLGDIALRYGPLIYNVEKADQPGIDQHVGDQPLEAAWQPELLDGVVVLRGKWQDGSTLTAIPNYARMNRVGPPHAYLGDPDINYAPGATTSNGTKTPAQVGDTAAPGTPVIVKPSAGAGNTAISGRQQRFTPPPVVSKVWI
ncbi:MAG TPA: beta-L-arabinofuranosidase domain-containing protein [Acidobacteriaceae bacterium]|nr:beta-L-arabinofuranosidase domain-containing protein [Acidobacteriaceae bacterium]